MIEIWKDINGYEGLYKVSNLGRVMSLKKNVTAGKGFCIRKERILNPFVTKKGYAHVRLYMNKSSKDFSVGRIVAIAFKSNPENKKEVNHINGIKNDNRAENLEWATGSENVRHAWSVGINKAVKGSLNPRSKLTEQKVVEIRARYSSGSINMRELANEHSVDFALIQRVIRRKSWSHVN